MQGLHPLVQSLEEIITDEIGSLPDLSILELDPKSKIIFGKLEGEELVISNQFYKCRGVRKLHVEIAKLGKNLQIFHCVFFPDPTFDLPVFGVDVVAGPAGISAAIVDLSPVGDQLPKIILNGLMNIQTPSFKQVRELPSWGTIFSPFVQFIRPYDRQDELGFMNVVKGYLKVFHTALLEVDAEFLDSPSTIVRYEAQINYCRQQKRNDKTRMILAKAFSPSWADHYLEVLLFDEPPPI